MGISAICNGTSQLSATQSQECLYVVVDKAKDFLTRAFTVIFVATIVIWFLQSFDTRLNPVSSGEASMLAGIGRWIAPVFAPLGFETGVLRLHC